MDDPKTPDSQADVTPSADPVPRPSGPGWIKIALAVSVALNLAVAGLAAGAFLKDGPGRGMPRDMSFGPFSEALTGKDRRALRQSLQERMPAFHETRAASRAEFTALLDSLRARPFDAAALQTALIAIEVRNAERLELGRELIAARLLQMTEAERLAFADRLEQGLQRRK